MGHRQQTARLNFDPGKHGSHDVFGEVYEYFLGQFAMNEGAKAGEFYTPKSVVNLLVEILAPLKGRIPVVQHLRLGRRQAYR